MMRLLSILIGLIALMAATAAAGSEALPPEARLTDQAGRTLTVARPFERIISLYGAHT